jgi:uncharacterized MAPEG superfamily protein
MSLFKVFRLAAPVNTMHRPQRQAARKLLVIALLSALAACSTTSKDEELRNSPEKLYAQAKEDLAAGSYEPAIKALEKVEGRAAGTVLAQQAHADQGRIDTLAMLFIGLRVAYVAVYLLNLGTIRTLVWTAGLATCVAILTLA